MSTFLAMVIGDLLTVLSGILVSHGWLNNDDLPGWIHGTTSIVVNGIICVGGLVWGWIVQHCLKKKVEDLKSVVNQQQNTINTQKQIIQGQT